MAGRFVRSSKFRHVFGTANKRDNCYDNVRITKSPHESNMCSVNSKFLAVVMEAQGGGAFLVSPLSNVGRFDINYPKVAGHRSQVLDIVWNPFNDNEIASCSEDCNIMIWEIPDGGLKENLTQPIRTLQGHSKKVSYVLWHPCAKSVLLSAGFDCKIIIWNTETGDKLSEIPDLTGKEQQIYSVSWNYDGSYFATSCKDKKLRIVDPRSGEVKMEGQGHQGNKPQKVIFCGTTNRLFSTGFTRMSERQYALWDACDLSKPLAMENIDSGTGVLFPFWDEGTKMAYICGKGDTQIKYFEVSPSSVFFLSMYQSKESQRGVGVLPKREVDFMKCEVMRFFKLQTKGLVEPISMTVPRKSEMFQDDIFPPCSSGKPALSAEEWASGTNKDPLLVAFSSDGIKDVDPAKCQVSTPLKFKVADSAAPSKKEPSVLKRLNSPPPENAPLPNPISLDEYKVAYTQVVEENKRLKKRIAELEGK